MPKHPETVDEYLAIGCGRCPLGSTPDCKVHSWDAELTAVRNILLETDLTEEIKWMVPTYTYDGKNIVMLSALKGYVNLGFLKGALLKDPAGILVKQTENMHEDRILKFTTVEEVAQVADHIKAYVAEAIEIEKAGLKVESRKVSDFGYPDELITIWEENPEFQEAFEALTPGRQKGYLLHFSSAKQSKTRTSRIEKAMPRIFEGKGLHDR
ncbi:MAG: DUF1801 domain-containing protein [Chloroflexota bacterium]